MKPALANDNFIIPYKDRPIDYTKPVMVYKNMRADLYSIKQHNLVVAHAIRLCMKGCKFKVNQNTRNKVMETRRKNVHAYICGLIVGSVGGQTATGKLPIEVGYNPYKDTRFTSRNFTPEHIVLSANMVILNENGVSYGN